MENIKLPARFESFSEARQSGFLAVKKIKEQGKKVAGVFCTYTPLELFMAAGLCHVGLCSTSDETIPDAEAHLPRNLCPLIKSSYGFALTDKCPYMFFSDLVVGETTCDGKKKMYELLSEIKNVHVMQLPNRQDELSRQMWHQEVLALKTRIEQDFGLIITEEAVRQAIHTKNQERALLKELYELSTACPPPITGLEQMQILFGAQFKFDYAAKLIELRETIDRIKAEYESGTHKVSKAAKRVILTGCPVGGVTEKIIRVIEESGGVVVALENCTGAKAVENPVDEMAADPYRALADRYIDIGCSVMTPDQNRYDLLSALVEKFQADAVVEMTLQACHTYNIETRQVKRLCEDIGVPFMSVETDYSTSDIAQLKTRVAAFLEMVQCPASV